MAARLIQTFTIPSSSVGGSLEVYVSSFNLYCKQRPGVYNNISGIVYPGASIYIIPTTLGKPDFRSPKKHQVASLVYDEIVPSITSNVKSKFNFQTPVNLQTDVQYGLVLDTDDPDLIFWTAKVGEVNVSAQRELTSIGFNGQLYSVASSQDSFSVIPSSALKFDLNVCRYFQNGVAVANVENYQFHIDNLEYVLFDYANSTGQLLGGEVIFPKGSATGNVSVVAGSNSVIATNAFSTWYTPNTDPMYIAIQSGNNYNVRRIQGISNTEAVVNEPISFTNTAASFYGPVPIASVFEWGTSDNPSKKFLILNKSTANSTVHFSNNETLVGEISGAVLANCQFTNYTSLGSRVAIPMTIPAGTSLTYSEAFLYSSNDNGNSFFSSPQTYPVSLGKLQYFSSPVALLSRSNEVQLVANASSRVPSNTSIVTANISSIYDYVIPTNQTDLYPVYFTKYHINNDYTNENGSYGNATSKSISSVISLATNQYAEDIKVYLTGYRPQNTDLKVFVKLFNTSDSDAFVDKDWTLLSCNSTLYSSSSNTSDIIQLEYDMLKTPNTAYTLAGTVTLANASANVVASSGIFAANIANGNLVKIYSPLFPNTNFMIASVVNVVNSTVITIDQTTSNNSLLGTSQSIDVLGYPHQAFLNNANNNIVRYYNSSMSYFDTFNSFAIKVVFLSSNSALVPYVTSTRAVAVSA